MTNFTYQGRDGILRIYDGANPPHYLKIIFSNMDFTGPFARNRPPDPIIPTFEGYTHAPEDASYDEAFYEPQAVSFSCRLDDTVNTWKLRDAMCNPDLKSTWKVGSDTWSTTKGRGSIILPTGDFIATRNFYDTKKVAVTIETLWEDRTSRSGSAFGLRYQEVYFSPADIQYIESPDGVELTVQGLVYGDIGVMSAFTSGIES